QKNREEDHDLLQEYAFHRFQRHADERDAPSRGQGQAVPARATEDYGRRSPRRLRPSAQWWPELHRHVRQEHRHERSGEGPVSNRHAVGRGRGCLIGVPIATEKKTTNLGRSPGISAFWLLETRLERLNSRSLIRECLSRIQIPRNPAIAA